MRKAIGACMALSLFLGAGTAWAACPSGTVLKVVGTAQTGSAAISASGVDVHYIQGACTGTACVATLYDGDTYSAEFTNATVRAEPAAAASGNFLLDLTESPLYFSDGVYFHDDGNVQGIVLLSCQPR